MLLFGAKAVIVTSIRPEVGNSAGGRILATSEGAAFASGIVMQAGHTIVTTKITTVALLTSSFGENVYLVQTDNSSYLIVVVDPMGWIK